MRTLDLLPAGDVLLDPRAGSRWKSLASLAAASRAGTGHSSSVVIGPSRTCHRCEAVERWLAQEGLRQAEWLATLQPKTARKWFQVSTKIRERKD